MSAEFVAGDLFATDLPALAHGCNCMGRMGAGIAKEFRRRYPAMYQAYRARCAEGAFRLGDVMIWQEGGKTIFNLPTQKRPGPRADLGAIEGALSSTIRLAEEHGIAEIGLPRIGAGLGSLPWQDVREVISRLGSTTTVRLVVFEEYRPEEPRCGSGQSPVQ